MKSLSVFLALAVAAAGMIAAAEPAPERVADNNQVAVTWWGCASVEVNLGDTRIAFDPFFKPDEPRFDYVTCSHHHYDHCHEDTLRKLAAPDGRLKMLLAPRSCFYSSRIPGPNKFEDGPIADLSFVPREKCIAFYPKYRHEDDPKFSGPTEIVLGRLRIEGFRSDEDGQPDEAAAKADPAALAGPWPNMGYLVTDTVTGRSVAHTGDIWKAYPQMQQMRGKVDVLFYPIGKLSFEEKVKMMDLIRPKVAIPMHYRLFEPGFPTPANFDTKVTEGELYKSPELLKKACVGGWYCGTPEDPIAEIARQREAFKKFTRVVELQAGVRYVLPAALDKFEGRRR